MRDPERQVEETERVEIVAADGGARGCEVEGGEEEGEEAEGVARVERAWIGASWSSGCGVCLGAGRCSGC